MKKKHKSPLAGASLTLWFNVFSRTDTFTKELIGYLKSRYGFKYVTAVHAGTFCQASVKLPDSWGIQAYRNFSSSDMEFYLSGLLNYLRCLEYLVGIERIVKRADKRPKKPLTLQEIARLAKKLQYSVKNWGTQEFPPHRKKQTKNKKQSMTGVRSRMGDCVDYGVIVW